MTTTFSISGGLNIVLAALGYVWLQKPYARKLYVLTVHDSVFLVDRSNVPAAAVAERPSWMRRSTGRSRVCSHAGMYCVHLTLQLLMITIESFRYTMPSE